MSNLLNSNAIYREYSTDESNEIYNNVLGTYNTEDFTIRLAYYIHEKLESLPTGRITLDDIDKETLEIYSTYLHETIHWRQHIGSTSGFILSLILPCQYLVLQVFLKKILDNIGPIKPLKKYYLENVTTNEPTDELFQNLNNVLNNYYDMCHYRNLVINPSILNQNGYEEEFYLSYGHSTAYTYINIIELLSHFFDNENDNIEIDNKIERLKALIKSQSESDNEAFNAFKENNKVIPPLGIKQIYEGQARFLQLQFLYFSDKNIFNMKKFRDDGLLLGIYGEAFELYLKIIQKEAPEDFNDYIIAIFLVVCDLSINPSVLFPLDINHEESFFFEAIPGIRFFQLCNSAKELINSGYNIIITNYSKEDYDRITSLLCNDLNYPLPEIMLNKIINWTNENEKIAEIMNECKTYSFKEEMLPIRFLFSKFIGFCQDKLNHPEFFCWTGACSAGKNLSETYINLTEKHKAPFINQKDLDVYAASYKDISEDNAEKLKDYFTLMNVITNLVRQWINDNGDFDVNFIKEINDKYNDDELKKSYGDIFKNHFNYDLSEFEIL